jgi:flagellar assembly protein FliH
MHETRHQGWLEGRAAGEADAMARNERRLADTIERLTHDLEGLAGSQQTSLARIERQATELAVTIVRKLFPAFVQRSGTVEIQALIAEADAALRAGDDRGDRADPDRRRRAERLRRPPQRPGRSGARGDGLQDRMERRRHGPGYRPPDA